MQLVENRLPQKWKQESAPFQWCRFLVGALEGPGLCACMEHGYLEIARERGFRPSLWPKQVDALQAQPPVSLYIRFPCGIQLRYPSHPAQAPMGRQI